MTQRRIYQSTFPYFVTFNTRQGIWLFDDDEYAKVLSRIMFTTCTMKGYDLLAYQIMPNHVHMLVCNVSRAHPAVGALDTVPPTAGTAARGGRKQYSISDLMHGIKSYFAAQIRLMYGIEFPVLHRRFYTRIVDTDQYLATLIEYITFNPVKEGLPKKFHCMPYQFIDWPSIKQLIN